MPKWSRVWKTTTDTCPQSCINFVDANSTQQPTVLDQFPSSVENMSQAMRLVADGIAERVGGKSVIVKSTAEYDFTITMRLSRDVASLVTITLKFGTKLNYPVQVAYTYQADSGSASFGDVNEVISWMAERLK